MTRLDTLMVLGVLVALAPFLGIPLSWLEIAFPLIGIAVALIGYSMKPKKVQSGTVEEALA